MSTHVIVTYATGIPVTSALAGIAAVTGCALGVARRYPLAVHLGCALAMAGFALYAAQNWAARDYWWAAPNAVLAAYWLWKLWKSADEVRSPHPALSVTPEQLAAMASAGRQGGR
jgi:hypothetical protein